MAAPASAASRSITSAIVVRARTSRAAAAASAKTPSASRPSGPSRSSTISSAVISAGGRPKEYPPFTPRCERRTPARRRTAKSCSRNWTGMSRRRARSPIGTGPSPERPSSASARRAYGLFVVIEITTDDCSRAAGSGAAGGVSGLQPAALGRDQDGLSAVNRAELAVDVVQVRADRARRERKLVRDLLVDLALGEALEHLDLARGQRARVDLARAADRRVRQVVHDAAQLARAEPDHAGTLEQLGRRDRAALRVVGEHVGQADEGGLAGRVVGVVALD